MRKYILPLLFIAVILFSSFALYQYFKDNNSNPTTSYVSKNDFNDKNNLDNNTTANADNNIDINSAKETSEVGAGGDGGTGGSSEEGSGTLLPPKNETRELPSDINTRDCGFYYLEYGMCTGTCSLGRCVSEGESCYCQNI